MCCVNIAAVNIMPLTAALFGRHHVGKGQVPDIKSFFKSVDHVISRLQKSMPSCES